jgi:hypothetical protein
VSAPSTHTSLSAATSLARRAAASSRSKANVPPLSPRRSSLVRWHVARVDLGGGARPVSVSLHRPSRRFNFGVETDPFGELSNQV